MIELLGDEQLTATILIYPTNLKHDEKYNACFYPHGTDKRIIDELSHDPTGKGDTPMLAAAELFVKAARLMGVDEPQLGIVSEIDMAMMPEVPYARPLDKQAMASKLIQAGYVVIAPAELDTWRYGGGVCPNCLERKL